MDHYDRLQYLANPSKAVDRIQQLEHLQHVQSARIVELEAALRPLFAYVEGDECEEDPDNESIGWQCDGKGGQGEPLKLTMGDIRRARAALGLARPRASDTRGVEA